ncbi:MAG: peptidase M48 [Sulfuricurvum sp. RIFOXYD2_FULL_44_160]|uniref:M48 family metallopeptidase n=1 Tax=unclassified Sulfuricurvum TaxID=2632390 RepID=UPI0008BFD5BD|nr:MULTISPECIES: M48 family metallopeptidase [unclassified Sulfuricurvum]OHD93202.1 MAG: peptidase M48 [Sulfuricurvum sp. RIFOXYD12_FULL_44_77]OHD96249.1 MAG: peptidase M48 [Sulfuricurvum sp. RIFOXYD2_FULL_44_160]
MITTVIGVYTLYIIIRLYVSVMQIGYINQIKCKGAVLMGEREYLDAANYAVAKEKLGMMETFVEYGLFLLWMGGMMAWLDSALVSQTPLTQTIIAVMGLIVINGLVMLPFGWIAKFKIDAKYGFNRSSTGQFVKDTLISTLLTLVIGSFMVWIVSLIITSSELWWLWSFAFIMAVVIAINMFFPTIRALFFDKVTPLEDPELRDQIEALMAKTGFVSSGVFISDASKRDARLNAYFGGLGKSKRVILFDTLIQKLTPSELVAVLGHELGHFAHGDLYKNITMVGVMLFGMFALFGNLPETLYMELGVSQSPHIVMMLFILLLPVVSFVMMPLMGIMSRHNEYEADRTGAELGGAEHLVNALKKLVSENKSFPLSHPLYRFFHTTHPPVVDRLRALGYDIRIEKDEGYADPCPND